MNVYDSQLLSEIKLIGYPSMLILMTVEGPIATIAASFAAKLGFFNLFIVFFLSLFGDILGDMILYSIGYFGGTRFLKKAVSFLKTKPKIIQKLEKLFSVHGFKTIFAVKSTTGLCWITFIAAGSLKMDFKEFARGSLLGGIVWSSFLVIVGYFFGYAFVTISKYLNYAKQTSLLILISFLIFYSLVTIYKKYKARKFIEN